jgi:hypothetical protein
MKPKKRFEPVTVKYVFSPEEKEEVSHKMASALERMESLDADKKAMTASFNEKILIAKNEASHYGRCITQGHESRIVECEITYDYTTHMVRWIRQDNFEVAEERKMTNAELQMEFEDADSK